MFSDTLRNPHFNAIAALLRRTFGASWRAAHPEIPLNQLLADLAKVTAPDSWNKDEALSQLLALITRISESKPSVSTNDLDWLVNIFDGAHPETTINLLLAWSSAPDELLTPAEAAALTNGAESTWRNMAANGELPGAFKKGKQWLIPRSVVLSR